MFNNRFQRRRWGWVIILGLIISTLLLGGCNNQTSGSGGNENNSGQPYHVGLLGAVDLFNNTLEGFQNEMSELGYTEGEDIVYDLQLAHSDPERMREIADQFVTDDVDLIVTTTNGGAVAAQAATEGTDIPVLFLMVLDPVEIGLVQSITEPEGNITGVSIPLEEYIGKRLDYLMQMDPDVERVWVPHNPNYSAAIMGLRSLNQAKDALDIELIETPVNSPEELIAQLEEFSEQEEPGFDAIHIMSDTIVQSPESVEAILTFAEEHNMPVLGNVVAQAEAGALFSYVPDNVETGQLGAPMADKILQGNDISSIPIVPTIPRLTINYQVAEELGLEIDTALLSQAIEIIR